MDSKCVFEGGPKIEIDTWRKNGKKLIFHVFGLRMVYQVTNSASLLLLTFNLAPTLNPNLWGYMGIRSDPIGPLIRGQYGVRGQILKWVYGVGGWQLLGLNWARNRLAMVSDPQNASLVRKGPDNYKWLIKVKFWNGSWTPIRFILEQRCHSILNWFERLRWSELIHCKKTKMNRLYLVHL